MTRVLIYLARFALIIIAYAIASLAASAFLHLAWLPGPGFSEQEAPAVMMGSIFSSIPFVALFVGYFAFVPSIPAILLAEILGKRDWLFYAITGAVVGLVVVGFIRSAAENWGGTPTSATLGVALIGSGMCGGIAYWLVAGRLAGNWRSRARQAMQTPPAG